MDRVTELPIYEVLTFIRYKRTLDK
jgi:hypothetical protein